MAKKYEHLELPSVKKIYKRKSPKGGPYKLVKRDYKKFFQIQEKNLDSISKRYEQEVRELKGYKQDIVFKLRTTQGVNDDQFRDELRRSGCEALLSAPGKDAEWIVSTQDKEFSKLKKKLEKRIEKTKSDFVDGILGIEEIKYDEKFGEGLKKHPLGVIEVAKLVISLNKKESDIDNTKLNSAIEFIIALTHDHTFEVYDKLITKNLCLLLIDANKKLANEIAKVDLVSEIDRPPQFEIEKLITSSLDKVGTGIPPPKDAHGILVMDSGIILHPLLVDSVIQPDGIVGLPDRLTQDDRSHGTMVAGTALYGDIKNCINQNNFQSEVWIYSAKIFYESGIDIIPGPDKLFENRIIESLEEIINKFPSCKVVNLSFGNTLRPMIGNKRQFDFAVLFDDLAIKHNNIIFVASSGNISGDFYQANQYPSYLLDEIEDVKIIDPATSVNAITVGALQQTKEGIELPSNITRVGPGLNKMVKPELVDIGGGFHNDVIVLNPEFRQRLFTLQKGTSFSAPKISHYLARLMNEHPNFSRNLIKALLISSASLPETIPDPIPKINSKTTSKEFQQILNIYGYGKPDFDKSKYSDDNRVGLIYEGEIELVQVKYFTITLPEEFVSVKGKRKISVSLAFDPPIRKRRSDYFGVRMEFHLFKNKPLEEVMTKYNELDLGKSDIDENEEGKVPKELIKSEIKLRPGNSIRKKTTHQKGSVVLTSRVDLKNNEPLVLAVLSQKRWKMDKNYSQRFAVVVILEHEKEIDLYNKIKTVNQIEVKAKIRV